LPLAQTDNCTRSIVTASGRGAVTKAACPVISASSREVSRMTPLRSSGGAE
jgi:hypothetical protein